MKGDVVLKVCNPVTLTMHKTWLLQLGGDWLLKLCSGRSKAAISRAVCVPWKSLWVISHEWRTGGDDGGSHAVAGQFLSRNALSANLSVIVGRQGSNGRPLECMNSKQLKQDMNKDLNGCHKSLGWPFNALIRLLRSSNLLLFARCWKGGFRNGHDEKYQQGATPIASELYVVFYWTRNAAALFLSPRESSDGIHGGQGEAHCDSIWC